MRGWRESGDEWRRSSAPVMDEPQLRCDAGTSGISQQTAESELQGYRVPSPPPACLQRPTPPGLCTPPSSTTTPTPPSRTFSGDGTPCLYLLHYKAVDRRDSS